MSSRSPGGCARCSPGRPSWTARTRSTSGNGRTTRSFTSRSKTSGPALSTTSSRCGPATWKSPPPPGLPQSWPGTSGFQWDAFDAWFEEDEQVYVHPRNPYTRVDALRSTRHVRVLLDGVRLAESSSPVLLFETGLPTRYYFNRTEVDFAHLVPEPETATACPYKGETSGYWSVRVGEVRHRHLAWTYTYPAAAVLPIAGLVAFYNEMVDIEVDGELLARPRTHFSR